LFAEQSTDLLFGVIDFNLKHRISQFQFSTRRFSRIDSMHRQEQAISRFGHGPEKHLVGRIGWLRAAVLGANDGIISTASLIVGVAAAATKQNDVLIAGVAGLVAGAMSMAAGEYVSVSSQSDTEKADLARERRELSEDPKAEHEELAEIRVHRLGRRREGEGAHPTEPIML
jgi:VIT1/CCC1 family predicted Fe2+/Mn2+ transporter